MERVKIFSLLRTFSDKEFKRFGLYLNSSLFNHSKQIRILFKILEKYYPEFENPESIKKKIFSAIYNDINYDDTKIRNLFKFMHYHIKGYLSFRRFKRNVLESEIFFLEELGDRVKGKLLNQELNEVMSTFINYEPKDEGYFLRLYRLGNIKIKDFENRQVITKGEEYYENILNNIGHLLNFSLISMLKKYLKILNAKRIHNIVADDKKVESIIDFVFKNFKNQEESPMVNLIHEFLKLYREDVEIETIFALKELNEKNKEHLTKEDYKSLYIELYNYCKRRQSEGKKEFGSISIGLMKEMLEKDLFLEKDGYMLDHTYINLASSAIRANELRWTKRFIVDFKDKIYQDKRESAFNFAYAMYYFINGKKISESKLKNFNTALQHLSKVKIEYFYYYTRVKNLYLMLYYEMNDFIHAESIIDSYRHYLKSNKELPEHLVARYTSFINHINKLFRLRENNTHSKLNRFKKEIISNNKFEYKRWFLEKIQELS